MRLETFVLWVLSLTWAYVAFWVVLIMLVMAL